MTFGRVRISLLSLMKGGLARGVLLWLGSALSNAFDRGIKQSDSPTPAEVTFGMSVTTPLLFRISTRLPQRTENRTCRQP